MARSLEVRRAFVSAALGALLGFACDGVADRFSPEPPGPPPSPMEAPDAAVALDAGGLPVVAPDAGADAGPIDPVADGGADAGAPPPPDAGVVHCTETYAVPPVGLAGWSPALSRSGADTLTYTPQHSHDDRAGPVGFCPAGVPGGTLYLKLVSARFETDQDPPSAACAVDYLAKDPSLEKYGMCFSGGNRHIYVEVRDEQGLRIAAGFDVFFAGQVVSVSDQGKPPNEFPMNFPINGGGAKYGARARYRHPTAGDLASDSVTNLRLPGNHHVNYLLTFQVARR